LEELLTKRSDEVSDPKDPVLESPVHDLIENRWSPCLFEEKTVSEQDLRSIFEAARWAASCFNEQPWRYIVARRERQDEFARLLTCLVEGNQIWAKSAGVLVLGVVSLRFSRNDKPNRHAMHDLGLASAQLTMEATARGLYVHQMAGILPDKAQDLYQIPEGFETVTALAIGYRAFPVDIDSDLAKRDLTPRRRRPSSAFLFESGWGQSARFLAGD
jgi:nitroreductase